MKRSIKTTALLLSAVWFLGSTAYAAMDIFTVPVDAMPQNEVEVSMSVSKNSVLEFAAGEMETRMGLEQGALDKVEIVALPTFADGAFYLDGVELEVADVLTRKELDRLCFVPNETADCATATVTFQGNDVIEAKLVIQILEAHNRPPQIENANCVTVENASINGYVAATDPDGDPVTIMVTQRPRKGEVRFDGLYFVYTPYQDRTGTDSFSVCAVDSHHNYSRPAVVEISIESNKNSFQYVDMAQNPSQYAAYKLYEAGTLQGEKVGQNWFFHPDDAVTRGEYLVMLLGVTGRDTEMEPMVNTGLPGDQDLPVWLKPYVKKGVQEGIISGNQPFAYSEIPTRAEAVQMCSNAAGIDDVKDYDLRVGDSRDIPGWALHSYKELAAYKMLDLHDGNAYPQKALNRSYCADLVWQLWKHCNL